ncbi:MAG: type II toxin-antitoxin system ParD family antitoxin [Alphaproteobacteria bacterium]|nr:type II toxin-antitoxin system ParD family antitoxin [Alphaproteobacteria bacterium]MBV9418746.1 type II toxin-antitoxin system ParD family antitoxin [Alphaproteobacteria bacterium]MBV9540790.1 type II toxin-antitoxin system ParD family antitoxin [Alphaproteobacteria bacterium]MBV9905876.1 type II toxin-antitoxin system ParD family antitoxin [Alphaproteobacteria bacterium]
MPSSVDLGPKLEKTISKLVAQGRYGSKSEVIREGVRLVEEREKRLAELDRALERGLADVAAGRTRPAEEVFEELRKRFSGKAKKPARKAARA